MAIRPTLSGFFSSDRSIELWPPWPVVNATTRAFTGLSGPRQHKRRAQPASRESRLADKEEVRGSSPRRPTPFPLVSGSLPVLWPRLSMRFTRAGSNGQQSAVPDVLPGREGSRSLGKAVVGEMGLGLFEQSPGNARRFAGVDPRLELRWHQWDRPGVDRQAAVGVQARLEVHQQVGCQLGEVASLVGAAALAAGHRP